MKDATPSKMAAWLVANTSRAERRQVERGDDSSILWLACKAFPDLTVNQRESVVLLAEEMIQRGRT